jgi:hypothetical protein
VFILSLLYLQCNYSAFDFHQVMERRKQLSILLSFQAENIYLAILIWEWNLEIWDWYVRSRVYSYNAVSCQLYCLYKYMYGYAYLDS